MFKRARLPAEFNTFDTGFSPLYPLGDGKLVSSVHILQRRLFQDALDGKRKAVSLILRYAQAQERARREQPRGLEWYYEGDELEVRWRPADNAMRLLSIASDDPNGGIVLESWIAQLARRRLGGPGLAEDVTRDANTPTSAVFRLPVHAPAPSRSAEATRFKKGQSGNPKGRPRKIKPDLPFTEYFEEVGDVMINGKTVRMTRLQYVLHMLILKAAKGDPCVTAVLSGKYLQEQLERYKRRDPNPIRPDPAAEKWDPTRIANNPFESMLRHLRITNRRTTTRALLEPWAVEAALARFGERRLTKAEQAEVLRSTSKSGTVVWPDWWEIRTHADAKPHIPTKPRKRKPRDTRDDVNWRE